VWYDGPRSWPWDEIARMLKMDNLKVPLLPDELMQQR
jgi:hypothetical protein